ncbi:DNA-processing protein DprA [Pseudobutyrivibrio xylanivorans]|uniref:DNA-protecting protein DprA n=1 Tax=Pseudobutyrivibrio xylanivorans TaxID=185007 RepID=A0A5P6VSS5_PSEXY|nr:DNA-processing protein DprA [Pseudobutyrivibrio xylanivorans]QFJ55470.1 DNA-protecting protein DprA [Pseudobutyrivibrio xylanivorans]
MNQQLYQYWFMKNEDISYGKKHKLLEYFFDSYHIYNATKSELMGSNLFDEKTADKFILNRSKFDLNKELEAFYHTPFSFITMEDEKFPEKLLNIYDPPYGLYYLGKLPDFSRCISIVGARRCSAYGKKMAQELGRELAKAGFTIISGMARGVDAYGHRGCLEAEGTTVAVLGSGCDVIYPTDNRLLYEEIAKSGAILSEYQMGTSPLAQNFPRRNRIVSALSDIVVVVEAREKSGSLITADFALEQGKDIFVVPGRVGDSLSTGCNKLLSQGAGVIWSTENFLKDLSTLYGSPVSSIENKNEKKNVRPTLTKEQRTVYNLFDLYPKSLSEVLEESRMDYLKLLSEVLALERMGLLCELFKNNYVKQET